MPPAISFSAYLASLPFEFLHWWFVDATLSLLKILRFIVGFFYHQFSINLIFRTYFKPWKNEYREGLVRFALFMGIFLKTLFLVFDLIFLAILIASESLVFILWLAFPFIILWGFYAAIFT